MDLKEILRKFDNDFEIFQAVAEVFLADSPKQMQRIEESIRRRDCHNLEETTHALKGAAKNFSTTIVAKTAASMESMAREGSIDDAARLYEDLKNEVEQLKLFLTKVISEGAI